MYNLPDGFVEFCQKLLQTPSLSGEEGEVADIIKCKMKQLNYDEVWSDSVGNVIGLIKGDSAKPSVCFTAHMDHVDPGEENSWEYPPYSGAIADGYIHGRGASDLKGVGATQIYIPILLQRFNINHGDIYIVQVVQEEKGGLGSLYLDSEIKNSIDYAINGEPSSNKIKIGHKGRIELIVEIKGKSVHASIPDQGKNPLFFAASFLSKLEKLPMIEWCGEHSTVSPTICLTDQQSSNVIPGKCTITLDWRNEPGENEEQIIDKMQELLPKDSNVRVAEYKLKTYTGLVYNMKRNRLPYSIERNHPLVIETTQAVSTTLHRQVEVSRWPFATDCGIFMEAGIPIIGFSPGEETYIHTNRERISLKLIREAMECYPSIISHICRLPKRNLYRGSK